MLKLAWLSAALSCLMLLSSPARSQETDPDDDRSESSPKGDFYIRASLDDPTILVMSSKTKKTLQNLKVPEDYGESGHQGTQHVNISPDGKLFF